jgi:hypothetical protein
MNWLKDKSIWGAIICAGSVATSIIVQWQLQGAEIAAIKSNASVLATRVQRMDDTGTVASQRNDASSQQRFKAIEDEAAQQKAVMDAIDAYVKKGKEERLIWQGGVNVSLQEIRDEQKASRERQNDQIKKLDDLLIRLTVGH